MSMLIPASVVVARTKSDSPWIDYLWRPVSVLPGAPSTAPWTLLSDDGARATFYAGQAEIALHPTETSAYRDNLATGAPSLWVVLRPTESEPPYELAAVTADPSEGEAMTEAGNNIVEPVPMPDAMRATIEAFVSEHHVDHVFEKRRRDRANTESLARRVPRGGERS